jgi:hypothetical protein
MPWFAYSSASHAATRADQLQQCLADFDGIAWVLPYQPPIDIRSCATHTIGYDASALAVPGRRRLELIGALTLPPDDNRLGSDETYAALQAAVLVHFEALFLERGYHRVAVEYGNAYTPDYSRTMGELGGGLTDAGDAAVAPAKEPTIPYIKLARYVRRSSDREITLTFKCELKNTWQIQIDGVPESAATGGRP